MPAHPVPERRSRPQPNHMQKCPRCESLDTKFCYYNNYSLTQPRYFCKNCKRYWTEGGSLRNVPVGGGLRKNKRSKQKGGGLADTASKDNDHQAVASIPGKLSSSQDAPKTFDNSNFRASNSVADEKYSFDSVRWAQRLYDSGEEASLGSHFNYMEAPPRNHALHLFPDYSYNLAAEGYDAGSYNNNLLQDAAAAASSEQGQSNNSGEMSEVLGATPPEDQTAAGMQASCSDPATSGQPTGLCSSQQQDLQAQKQIHRMEDEDEDVDEHEDRSGAAMASKNKLLQSSKPTNGATMHDSRSEEICGNIVNPYDWQLISEGLFSTSGDFFYFPGASWPDVSHFESGPG